MDHYETITKRSLKKYGPKLPKGFVHRGNKREAAFIAALNILTLIFGSIAFVLVVSGLIFIALLIGGQL